MTPESNDAANASAGQDAVTTVVVPCKELGVQIIADEGCTSGESGGKGRARKTGGLDGMKPRAALTVMRVSRGTAGGEEELLTPGPEWEWSR